jgi:hypothetical protein
MLNTAVDIQVNSPPFDESLAKRQMAKGRNSVKGVLFHKIQRTGKHAGQDAGALSSVPAQMMPSVRVFLYPATEHLLTVARMEIENRRNNKLGGQRKRFIPDPRVFQYSLSASTDQNGLFEFKNISPGKYVLIAENRVLSSSGSDTVPTGTSWETAGVIVTNRGGLYEVPRMKVHTEQSSFRVDTELFFEQVLEVPESNSPVRVEARMRPGVTLSSLFGINSNGF